MTNDNTSPYAQPGSFGQKASTNPYIPTASQMPVAFTPDAPARYESAPRLRRSGLEITKLVFRLTGTLVIAVLAVVAFFLAGPNDFTPQHSAEREEFAAAHALNEELTSGAPQQSVVNGWTQNDLLGLISRQLDDGSGGDQRPAILLTLGVLLLALRTVTEPGTTARPATAPDARH